MSQKIIQIKTSVSSFEEAENLAQKLVENKLAACVQYFPIKSIYRWKGNIEKSEEHVLLIKTSSSRRDLIVKTIQKIHSYELPEIVMLEKDFVTEEYSFWVEFETSVDSDLDED
ncbi:MAG: divalent-cation tolerance protein CutA [Candidatus Heimdallarchaeota archaeon]|nr:divalent-cation tolerance protein CutA [Candidatus Heimdallarchaeota archaeon]